MFHMIYIILLTSYLSWSIPSRLQKAISIFILALKGKNRKEYGEIFHCDTTSVVCHVPHYYKYPLKNILHHRINDARRARPWVYPLRHRKAVRLKYTIREPFAPQSHGTFSSRTRDFYAYHKRWIIHARSDMKNRRRLVFHNRFAAPSRNSSNTLF